MKQVLLGLIAFSAVVAVAQDEVVQSGTPAMLEAANGKKARVMLQRLTDGKLTFQPYKSPKDMTVPSSKIKSLGFSMTQEEFETFRADGIISNEEIAEISKQENVGKAEKLDQMFSKALGNIAGRFNKAEYESVVGALEPVLRERGQFMAIDNNLYSAFVMYMDSHHRLGDLAKVKDLAEILIQSEAADKVLKAKVANALIAIEGKDFAAAEAVRGELDSTAASLYLKAEILRAKEQAKDAMKLVSEIIYNHGNDQDWLPHCELLSAYLYLDMAMTNSAALTARQVKNMYTGSNISGDAAKLEASLGVVNADAEEEPVVEQAGDMDETVDSAAESTDAPSTNEAVVVTAEDASAADTSEQM